jgi:hypothetical protein
MRIETRAFMTLCCCMLLVACRIGGPAPEAVTVTVSSPDNNAYVPFGKPVQVSVTATAATGITRVELSVNGTLVAVSNNAEANSPYQPAIFYTPLTEGTLNLIVRAYDKNNTASAPVGLTLVSVPESQATTDPDGTAIIASPVPGSTTNPPAATPTAIAGVVGPDGCTLNAQFIADVTVPDGATIPLRANFIKTWRVRNTGSCTWNNTYKLVFASGNQFNAPGSVPLSTAKPNDVIDISVPMQGPAGESRSLGAEWRFAAPNNTIFGNALTVVISLPVPTPTSTLPPPTATPTPTIEFSTNSTTIARGSCATLRWSTSNVSAVFLNDVGVVSPSSKDVCPTEVATYTLKVNLNDGTSASRILVVNVTSGVLMYSFANNAPLVRWYNDLTDTMAYGGLDTDSRGFALNRDGQALEDSSLQLKVIETHPRWTTGGTISGDFNVPVTVESGDRFRTRIGFLNGATSGSVTLRVLFKGIVVGETTKAYDGTLKDWNINLSGYVGQTGMFTIEAIGTPTATQAWICWINPRIER